MNRFCALVCLVVGSMTALACGGNVVVDSPAGGGGSSSSSSSTLGEGAASTTCPVSPTDSDLMSLTGQPCDVAGSACVAFDVGGCGECKDSCVAGVWSAPECVMIMDC